MEIIKASSEIENPLFSRKEIVVEITSASSPKMEEVAKAICKKFSVAEDSLKIESIIPRFGSKILTVSAKAYSSKKDMDETEIGKKQKGEKK